MRSMAMQINETIIQLIQDALTKLNVEGEVLLEHPSDLAHGDFSCNVAMTTMRDIAKLYPTAKTDKMQVVRPDLLSLGSPADLANKIILEIPEHEDIDKVEVAGPGFINFYLSEDFFTKQTTEISEDWGNTDANKGKKVLLEHSSPNLFKPFHIGHLVNNSLGESLVRLVRATGADVTALSFPSDVSPGIAKAVWAVLEKGWQDDLTLERIGEAYVYGVNSYKDDEAVKAKIDEINTSLYNNEKNTPEWDVYEKGRSVSLDYFKSITAKLGSEFSELIFESDSEIEGKNIVKENTPKVFEESDGAIIFRGSEHGLFDNVFINSAGFGTYLTKDIGLLSIKFNKYDFDTSVTVTDVEQKHHFELVKKSAEFINPEWAEKSNYIQHGRLELTSGKISSRTGNVPLAEDMIESAKERAIERMKENEKEVDETVAQQIAIAAIKYTIVRVGMGKNIVFDMDSSLSFEGDTGPYLQYTHARALSILRKAEGEIETSNNRGGLAVTNIEKLLYRFPSVVARAAKEYEPHYVANYLAELAGAYNSWYAQEQVLDGGEAQGYKLALTSAVATTLKNGLYSLGIEAPEQM